MGGVRDQTQQIKVLKDLLKSEIVNLMYIDIVEDAKNQLTDKEIIKFMSVLDSILPLDEKPKPKKYNKKPKTAKPS
jgi:hypothetical protein